LSEQKKNMSDTLKFDTLKRMVELVYEMRDVLYSGDLAHFGMLLHKNWVLKKTLASKISTSAIDKIYDKALDSGAIGGKLLGAGGGGFLLFYCEKSNQDRLRKALAPLRELNFSFENEGTKVIYIGDEYNER
jgi:D-glycero-alpha-D-manno-heptose-7-phosphate kinase